MEKHSREFLFFTLTAIVVLCSVMGCLAQVEPIKIEGRTMGTTYHIIYFDGKNRSFKNSIDSLLIVVNKSINNYDSTSEVSRFNQSKRGVSISLPYFLFPIKKSREIFHASAGAFDPTVLPLVNAWGFGTRNRVDLDNAQIDSIRSFIGFEKISFSADSVTKSDPRLQLDFGGIGQGYGADVVSDFLRSKGITNMLVELGGEGMAVGKNLKTDAPWHVGILHPHSTLENQFFKGYVTVTDKSFTTSGNYFNYYEKDGRKYSHIIDPATGFPAHRAILSASVFTTDCITADAWATAFMVMGHERAIETIKRTPGLDAILMFSTPEGKVETFISSGIKPFVTLEP